MLHLMKYNLTPCPSDENHDEIGLPELRPWQFEIVHKSEVVAVSDFDFELYIYWFPILDYTK